MKNCKTLYVAAVLVVVAALAACGETYVATFTTSTTTTPAATTGAIETTSTVAPSTTTTPAATTGAVETTTTVATSTTTTTTTAVASTTTTVADLVGCQFSDHSERTLAAVWQVGGLAGGSGSAFYIGDGEWLTAAHVVGDATTAVLYNGFRDLPVTVVGVDVARDTALLVGSGADVPPLELGESLPRPGDPAHVVGFPLYDELSASISRGIVSRLEQDPILGTVVVTDAATNPGNSGGPLVDDCGRVVGMMVRKYVDVTVEGLGYAVAGEGLVARLPQLRRGGGSSTTSTSEATPWWTFFPVVTFPSISGTFTDVHNVEFPVAFVEASDYEGRTLSEGPYLSASCDFWSLGPMATASIEATYWIDSGPGRDTVWTHLEETPALLLRGAEAVQLGAALQQHPQGQVLTIRWSDDDGYYGTATFPIRGYATQKAELDRHCGK